MPVWPNLKEYRNKDKKRDHEKEIAEQLKCCQRTCALSRNALTHQSCLWVHFRWPDPSHRKSKNMDPIQPNPNQPDTADSKTVWQFMSVIFEHINTIFITIKYKLIPIARNGLTGVQNVLCIWLSMPACIPHLSNKFHWFDVSRRQLRPNIVCPTGRNHAQIELRWLICTDNQYVKFTTTAEQLIWHNIVCCVMIKRYSTGTFAHLKRYKNCRQVYQENTRSKWRQERGN